MHALTANQPLPALVVITGNEPLLVLEAGDALRERAREDGFTEQHRFVMDARSDWQAALSSGSSGSLFGDRQWWRYRCLAASLARLAPARLKR
ncbi:MAG: hypothetical protein LRY56_07940 [Burkholderiaceae bacterium]|nr:hypothetical protein [Burkholderiaceae bacterium]